VRRSEVVGNIFRMMIAQVERKVGERVIKNEGGCLNTKIGILLLVPAGRGHNNKPHGALAA
jgi:hypothetical protein